MALEVKASVEPEPNVDRYNAWKFRELKRVLAAREEREAAAKQVDCPSPIMYLFVDSSGVFSTLLKYNFHLVHSA